MNSEPVIAIDFGSSRTKMAYRHPKKGDVRLARIDRNSAEFMPSLVHVPDHPSKPRRVGSDAEDAAQDDPVGLIYDIKRDIHKPSPIAFDGSRPDVGRVEAASHIFQHLRGIAERQVFGMPMESCRLTVPAACPEPQREGMEKAAKSAGFASAEFMAEPVAAAYAWIHESARAVEDGPVVVCDIGGGTTDFAVVEVRDGLPAEHRGVLPEAIRSGGNDLDDRIISQLIKSADPEKGGMMDRIRNFWVNRVRSIRETLRNRDRDTFRLSEGLPEVTREQVERVQGSFVEEVAESLRRYVARNRDEIGTGRPRILLVGGGARIPGMYEAIEALDLGQVIPWDQGDFAVVRGALLKGAGQGGKIENIERDDGVLEATAPKDARLENLSRYREILREAFADGDISGLEAQFILSKRAELKLVESEAVAMEAQVLGLPMRDFLSSAKYRVVVQRLVGGEISDGQWKGMIDLRAKLGLSLQEANLIESAAWGGKTLEEICSPEHGEDELMERWLSAEELFDGKALIVPDGRKPGVWVQLFDRCADALGVPDGHKPGVWLQRLNGAHDGEKRRIKGLGKPGRYGGLRGDLIVTLRVPHSHADVSSQGGTKEPGGSAPRSGSEVQHQKLPPPLPTPGLGAADDSPGAGVESRNYSARERHQAGVATANKFLVIGLLLHTFAAVIIPILVLAAQGEPIIMSFGPVLMFGVFTALLTGVIAYLIGYFVGLVSPAKALDRMSLKQGR